MESDTVEGEQHKGMLVNGTTLALTILDLTKQRNNKGFHFFFLNIAKVAGTDLGTCVGDIRKTVYVFHN